MRQELARSPRQCRVGIGHDALQHLERLRHHTAIRIGQLRFELTARAGSAVRFGCNAAPAPIGITRGRRGGGDARAAVSLGDRNQRLPSQREHAAGESCAQRFKRARAAQDAQRRLRLHRDADIAVRHERYDCRRQRRIPERRERPQRVDADVRVAVGEQPAQPGDGVLRIELRAVEQRSADAARGDHARLWIGIVEPAHQRRGAFLGPQARQRIERPPTGVRLRCIGEAYELRDGSTRGQSPRLEQRLIDDEIRATRRCSSQNLAERARAIIAADLRDGGDRLHLGGGRTLPRRRRGLDRCHERGNRTRVLEQAERECRGRLDGGDGVVQHGKEQVDRGAVADASRSKRGLAAHGRIRVAQPLAQAGGIEAASIGRRQELGEHADSRLVGGTRLLGCGNGGRSQ